MSSHLPASLLTLPAELRTKIYHLALHDNPAISLSTPYRIPNLSLLSTNRQIYHESRSIPPLFFYYGREYKPNESLLRNLRPFQIAALRSLCIFYLYPGDLEKFTAPLREGNGFLFNEPSLRLDTLTIYTDDWLTRTNSHGWRNIVEEGDVHYDLPRSSRWLRSLCGLTGWRQLELSFSDLELEEEYHTNGSFITPLFDDFGATMGAAGLCKAFTIWHKQNQNEPCGETITVLRTQDLHLHSSPQWEKKDLVKLVEGNECIVVPDFDDAGYGFHVSERYGSPTVAGRSGFCPSCVASVDGDDWV
ncbi:hypothetical protein ABVK25_002115 [Lepraria finkii]|uniref:F-box domain-containing protein n=1 Tax=Lepraria finkii TaxID=1340010 RepID=A0ABR4BIT4_9LECA